MTSPRCLTRGCNRRNGEFNGFCRRCHPLITDEEHDTLCRLVNEAGRRVTDAAGERLTRYKRRLARDIAARIAVQSERKQLTQQRWYLGRSRR